MPAASPAVFAIAAKICFGATCEDHAFSSKATTEVVLKVPEDAQGRAVRVAVTRLPDGYFRARVWLLSPGVEDIGPAVVTNVFPFDSTMSWMSGEEGKDIALDFSISK